MKKIYLFMLMAVGLLVSGNSWANYFTSEIEAKPAPEIIEEPMIADGQVFDVIVDNASPVPSKAPMIEEGNVAKIGETGYATLADAIAAANAIEEGGAVIELLQSTTLSKADINKDMTIDLKNFEVTISLTRVETFVVNANLTIKGYENETQGKISADFGIVTSGSTNYYSCLFQVGATGSLTIESGNLNGSSYVVYSNGAVSIEGEHTTLYGKSVELYVATANIPVTINGPQSGLYINDLKGATYTLNGTVTLGGGTLCPAAKAYFSEANLAKGKSFIKSLSSGSEVYTIGSLSSIAASVGEYMFTDLKTACANSSEETPAKMLKDYSSTSYFYPADSYWLDLNGHTMSVKFVPVMDNVTIMDNSESHTGEIVNNSTSCTIYLYKDGASFTLLGGTIKAGNGVYAIFPNDQSFVCTTTISGPYAKVEADGYGVTMYGKNPGSSVTVTDGATIIGGPCLGNLGTYTDMNTTMTISNGAKLISEGTTIYHPGGGYLNISGEETELIGGFSVIEIRAGELNISGGKFISTWKATESESFGNGNGTTTTGAAIAVAQHSTQKPITVTITGGDFEGVIPVKLANPQNNPEEDINKVSVAINGGRYKVVNGAGAPFWSITENFAVSAGKFSHVPAYVVPGKTVIPNPDGDKDIYPWTIGEVNATPISPSGDITWQTGTDWPDNKVPTSQDKVTLTNGQNITVSGSSDEVAEAYSITIPTGSTLTVESGATLVIGGGGITNEGGETNINGLKVEPGAQVIVSPDANMEGLYGRVALTPNVGKYPTEMVGEWYNKPNRYQLVGIPTKEQPTISKNKADGDGFKLNQWDVETGWKAASLSDFSVPFKGFFFWNDVPVTENASDLVTYYFKGELFGNKPQTLVFTEHEGFHLFANSYLAEVDIMALIQGAENDVQKAVYVYDPVLEKFTDISYATYGKLGVPSAIAPMQGFYFLNQHNATTAPMDYVSMVWSNAFKVEQEFVPTNAPRRNAAIDGSEVRINITDNVAGRTDGVYVMENDKYSAELDGSDVQKMMNPATSVNIYATTPVGNLSTMQTNDIENQYLTIETNAAPMYTMSFDWVAGDELYLLDTYNGRTTLMTEGNTYEFAAQPKSIINDRFQIVKTAAQAPTNMENVKNIKAVKGTYTVTGQCLGENVDWDKLPQGVYVIDGVKVVK